MVFAPAAQRAGMIDSIETLATAVSTTPGALRHGAVVIASPRAVSQNPRRRRLQLLRHS
jgi:hypothetical protein